jgi:hypothetical protein
MAGVVPAIFAVEGDFYGYYFPKASERNEETGKAARQG